MIKEAVRNVGNELYAGVNLAIDMPFWDNRVYLRNMMMEVAGREHAGERVSRLDLLFIHLKTTPEERGRFRILREKGIILDPASLGEQARMTEDN